MKLRKRQALSSVLSWRSYFTLFTNSPSSVKGNMLCVNRHNLALPLSRDVHTPVKRWVFSSNQPQVWPHRYDERRFSKVQRSQILPGNSIVHTQQRENNTGDGERRQLTSHPSNPGRQSPWRADAVQRVRWKTRVGCAHNCARATCPSLRERLVLASGSDKNVMCVQHSS